MNGTSGAVELYINGGHADNRLTGDGIQFADINGDGLDDYVFVDTGGQLTVYINGGANPNANLGWIWIAQNNGNPIATGIGSKQSQIHLADIDGDGKADYLSVDPVTGAVIYYRNGGPNSAANGGWIWVDEGQIASGLGAGAGVRFADIDGDGRADYIWLSESGAATVYINYVGKIAPNWVALNNGQPIATGVGAYRKDVRFADINGDGRADYIWVHPVDGSLDLWTNEVGINPANWVKAPDKIATGVGFSGANILFATLLNTGRADYIPITPSTGAIEAWMNGCNNPASPVGGGGGAGGGGGGSGSGIVYIDTSIWSQPNPMVQCLPPCTLVLPPFPLATALTLSWPPWTTSFLSSTAGTVVTKTTIITIPAVTTTEIDFWPVTILPSDPTAGTITPEQSIMPPSTIITLPGTEASIQVIQTSNPSTTTTTTIVPIFFPTPHPVTIQPQPTISAPVPPPGPPPGGGPSPVSYTNGPPKPTCLIHCGTYPCLFGCGGGCGLFGCGGGCGIFGCGGGCGLGGCHPGGGGGGGGGGGSGPPDPSPSPTKLTSTSSCTTGTTTMCDTVCTILGRTCTTLCDTVFASCPTANFPTFTQAIADVDNLPVLGDNQIESDASYVATFMNPILTFDSVGINGTPFTAGMTATPPPLPLPTPTKPLPPSSPSPAPTKPLPPPPPPEATCSVIRDVAGTTVAIYTNYITDNGDALKKAAIAACPGIVPLTVTKSAFKFTAADGTTWLSTLVMEFGAKFTSQDQISCVKKSIIAAGGPSNTPDCDVPSIPQPIPPPLPPPPPQATCKAVANLANTEVGIWTNYITDNGAALLTAEMNGCPHVSGWTVQSNSATFTATGGAKWTATQLFTFRFLPLRPAQVACVARAIKAAGGPANTGDCPFTAAISPP